MRVAITGNYASGKSTVSIFFEELGAVILDTDKIAREVVLPGQRAFNKIIDHFGKKVLSEDMTINRAKLASIVFSDKNELQVLNSITHPEIHKLTMKRSLNKKNIYLINVPLLFETNFKDMMDKVIIVTAPVEALIERGKLRDKISKEEIDMRLKSQISFNKYLKQADYIIDNSNSINNTKEQVLNIWNNMVTDMK
ncbi:MAG: dephospho-CoA kinase [Spirochaetes bacterium]|jgi:dephospho-CoA kinase|nr:dephospho-CoA kinase [Spirochaetota bacterium]